jgi:hypothetical protein
MHLTDYVSVKPLFPTSPCPSFYSVPCTRTCVTPPVLSTQLSISPRTAQCLQLHYRPSVSSVFQHLLVSNRAHPVKRISFRRFLLTPWLYGPLRTLTSFMADAYSHLLFDIWLHLFTFRPNESFSTSYCQFNAQILSNLCRFGILCISVTPYPFLGLHVQPIVTTILHGPDTTRWPV